jgi:hypothetical protein
MLSAGIILGIVGLFIFAVSMAMIADPTPTKDAEGNETDGNITSGICTMAFCLPIFWIPGGVLIYMGLQKRSGSTNLDDVVSVLRSYDEISIEDAAEMLDLSEMVCERKITRCIGRGMVQGKIVNGIYYSHSKLEYFQKRTNWVERLKDIAEILNAYRRVGIGMVADKIGEDVPTTERLILECLEEDMVKGFLSTKQHVFYTQDYLDQIDDVRIGWSCEQCGASHDEVLLPGDYGTCNYCGSLSGIKGTSNDDEEIEAIVL